MTAIPPTSAATGSPIVTGRSLPATSLGQKDFLTLLTAQLKNQDPTNPIQNSDFVAQLAQFSTVSGIGQVNTTLASIDSGLGAVGLASAAGLIGRQVLVPGDLARPDAAGRIAGAVTLAQPGSVTLTFSDAASGAVLGTQVLQGQTAGQVDFAWSGTPAALVAAHGQVRIGASQATATGAQMLDPLVYAQVLSAQTTAGTQDITLNVEDYGAVNSLEVGNLR